MDYSEFLDFVKTRRSIRKYRDEKISRNTFDKIFDAGRYAPSWLNEQPWEIILIDDKELKKKVRNIYDNARAELGLYEQDSSFLENAYLAVVCADLSKKAPEFGAALSVQNMLLAAHSIGIGANVMGTPLATENSRRQMRSLFEVPEKYGMLVLLAFGHADENPGPKPRKEISEFVHENKF